jgi:hypothetical protein
MPPRGFIFPEILPPKASRVRPPHAAGGVIVQGGRKWKPIM